MKGVSDTINYVLYLILGIFFFLIVLQIVPPLLYSAESSATGCTLFNSVIADITGGLLETC